MDLTTRASRVLVSRGWGAQWSPDGKIIAYTQGPTIRTIDPATEVVSMVLAAAESPYQEIFWNMGWSPDSNRLCFKGVRKDGTPEVATIRLVGGPDLKVHYRGQQPFNNSFAWSPDGKRIAFSFRSADQPRKLMHTLDPDRTDLPPTPFRGTDESLIAYDPCWTPDNQALIFDTLAE